jgi:CheY-like chemotaxis protein
LNERQGISIAVLTTNQDDVEVVNKALRDAGHAAHCHWIRQSDAFDSMLRKDRVELIILNCDSYPDAIRQVIRQKDAYIPEVPVIATSKSVDEAHIDQAMQQGARPFR